MAHSSKRVVSAALVVVLVSAASASGEVEPGDIAASSIRTAYTTQPSTAYRGGFRPDTKTFHDLDYLAFPVAKAGETVEFTLQNTTTGVNPNPYEYCPVYLSLLNQSNTLIADGAGTIATYGDTEVFRWTFQTAGTYYMVMESNGDMPAGDPTYAVSYRVTSGSQSSPLIRSLHVARHQLGTSVTARVDLGQPAALIRALLVSERGKTIAVDTRHALGVGRERLTLELPASYRRVLKDRHRLRLTVKLKVAGASGHASFSRPITLTG